MWAWILQLIVKVPGLLSGPVTQFFTGINIQAILSAIVDSVKKHWRFYLPIALVVFQLITIGGWYHEHTLLVKERVSHQLDISNFKKAQAEADAKAKTQKSILDRESKANADEADTKYSSLLAQYRANLVRYKASQSGTSGINHSELPPAESGNGPSNGSEVSTVVISGDDAQICAVNTARLQAVHDWAVNPPKDGIE